MLTNASVQTTPTLVSILSNCFNSSILPLCKFANTIVPGTYQPGREGEIAQCETPLLDPSPSLPLDISTDGGITWITAGSFAVDSLGDISTVPRIQELVFGVQYNITWPVNASYSGVNIWAIVYQDHINGQQFSPNDNEGNSWTSFAKDSILIGDSVPNQGFFIFDLPTSNLSNHNATAFSFRLDFVLQGNKRWVQIVAALVYEVVVPVVYELRYGLCYGRFLHPANASNHPKLLWT
jgi:hypothetical protein